MECLNTTKLRAILSELEGVSNWHALGIRLGVPPDKLDVIEQNHSKDAVRCKTETIRRWLNNAATPNWKNLALALYEIGEKGAAGKIEEKYLKCKGLLQNHYKSLFSTDFIVPPAQVLLC